MDTKVYYHTQTLEHERGQELVIEEALIRNAHLDTIHDDALALTVQLSCQQGFTVAVFTELQGMFSLLQDLQVERPEDLSGQKVLAYFTGRKLVGLSAAP